MPDSKADIKERYPLPVYNYRVEIGDKSVGFSEVSGLSISYETYTYKESRTEGSAPGPRVVHMPAQGTPATITLKKGIMTGEMATYFFAWINSIAINQVEKRDITVHLCNEAGEPVVSWRVTNAFPTKLEAPSFEAESQDVAIESMELMADNIMIESA